MKTLQDLLQERAEHVEAQAALLKAAEDEERDLSEEEAAAFDEHDAAIASLDTEIEAAQKREDRKAKVQARVQGLSALATDPPRAPAFHSNGHREPEYDDAGFRNVGDFVHSLRFADHDQRLAKLPVGTGEGGGVQVPEAFARAIMPGRFRAEQSMSAGQEGGFAVPTQFRDTLLAISPEGAIMRPGATVIPAGSPPDGQVSMPALNQGTRGVFSGVTVQWIAEGQTKPETDAELLEITLQPKEVAAHIVVSDKLLRNWQAAAVTLERLLRGATTAAEDFAFLRGDGVGKPLGVLNGTGTIAHNRQVANQISYDDIINMLARLLPESVNGAVWVASQTALPQLAQIQDGAGRFIFAGADATRGIPASLLGMPLYFTGRTPTLGAKGDLMLVDRTYYLIKDGSGPFVAASEHVLFRSNKTVIKIYWNVDGQAWVRDPLQLEDGATTVSPHVVLDVP